MTSDRRIPNWPVIAICAGIPGVAGLVMFGAVWMGMR